MPEKKKNITLEIILDDEFTGVMYGLPEESSGCKMKGKIILNNRSSISAKHLFFSFIGKITVACGPPMYATRPEYSEIQVIYRKEILFYNSETDSKKIPNGTHEYDFDFELPGHLPSSFKGSRGRIEYCCNATLSRPMFHSAISVKKTVQIKRCLMNETRSAQHHTTFSEGLLDEKIRYQISTPIMTFHDGGLIQTELTLKSTDSDTIIEAVEYGLKEQVQYQTTGEQVNTMIANVNESRFPLGEDRVEVVHDAYPIEINVRLCPWVNCDVNSQLISINHTLSFTVCVSEKIKVENEGHETNRRNSHRLSFPVLGLSREGGRVTSLPPTKIATKRSSRTFSLSAVMNYQNQKAMQLTKVEKKRLHFEIPIIVTTKSVGQGQQTPPYTQVDRPPTYAIATMLPPPPLYVGTSASDVHNLLSSEHNWPTEFVAQDDDFELEEAEAEAVEV